LPAGARPAALALLALASGFLVAGCGGGEPETELPRRTLTIGYRAGPAGALAARDRAIVQTARIAVSEINRLGIDRRVRLRLEPTPGRAWAVLLPCDPVAAAAVARLAARRGALAVAPCNADPRAVRRGRRYVPVAAGTNDEAAQLADYLRDEGHERAFLVTASDLPYARLLAGYFERAAAGRAIEVVGKAAAPVGERSFRGEVRAIARAEPRPDIVVTSLFFPSALAFVRALREAGVTTPVAGMDGMDGRFSADAAAALEGTVFTTFGYPEPGLGTDELYEKYKARLGRRPEGSYAALGYDAVKVLEAAINEAESVEPGAVAAALADLDVQGALGKISYPRGGDRNPAREIAVVEIEGGEPTLVEKSTPDDVPSP
jgi:branched-chain amino acid transport system substrate-binding protein